jgi:hypothetical protein
MDGKPAQVIDKALSGHQLLNDPLLNKGTAFAAVRAKMWESAYATLRRASSPRTV